MHRWVKKIKKENQTTETRRHGEERGKEENTRKGLLDSLVLYSSFLILIILFDSFIQSKKNRITG